MRSHRGAMLVLVFLLSVGLAGTAPLLLARAQDVPIEPLEPAGTGAQPDELVVDGIQYLRDRDVVVNINPLQQLTDDNGNTVYQKPGGSDPLGAIYVLSTDSQGEATRYLPEHIGDAGATCPADLVDAGAIQGEGATYVPVGPETDMAVDQLTQIGTAGDGLEIYTYSPDQSFTEILVPASQGEGGGQLVRYMQVDDSGIPASFADQLTFGGQEFVPAPGAVATFDGLTRLGCAGLFPAWAASADPPFSTLILDVNEQAVSFESSTVEVGTPLPQTPVASPPSTPDETVATPPPATPIEVIATPPPATPEPTVPPTQEPTVPSPEPTSTTVPEPTATATVLPPTATAPPPATTTVVVTTAPTSTTAPPTDVPPTATAMVTDVADDQVEALPTALPATPSPGTPESTLPPARPTPTRTPLQPKAVVPTLPPDAPSPPASRITTVECSGVSGPVDANGVPERLPRTIQFSGSGYRYSGKVAAADVDAATLTEAGCAGPFVILTGDDQNALYLAQGSARDVLYRFEKTESFVVRSEVTDLPRSIQTAGTADQPAVTYRASEPLERSVYSSVSLILYGSNGEESIPDQLFGYAVGTDLIGAYAVDGVPDPAPQDVQDRAEAAGIHAELLLGGQRYVLTALWTPYGTTTNGWVTLYGSEGNASPDQLVGIDPRSPNLMVFDKRD